MSIAVGITIKVKSLHEILQNPDFTYDQTIDGIRFKHEQYTMCPSLCDKVLDNIYLAHHENLTHIKYTWCYLNILEGTYDVMLNTVVEQVKAISDEVITPTTKICTCSNRDLFNYGCRCGYSKE